MSINKVRDMVTNPLTDDVLKEIINIIEKNPSEKLYSLLKKTTFEGFLEYESTIKEILLKKIKRIIGYSRESIEKINNPLFLNDYDLLKESYNLLSDMSLTDIFRSEFYSKIKYKTVFPQENDPNSNYIHVKDINFPKNIDCRIYMCPKAENCMQLCRLIVEKHEEHNIPCYFKINTNTEENDRFVMYSSYDMFETHCKIMKEIQAEHPQLFEQSKKNLLWSDIKDYSNIYFGAEPSRTGFESYSGRLCRAIEQAYKDFKHLYENGTYDEFKEYLKYELLKVNIDPSNPVFNYSEEKVTDVDDGITKINYNSVDYPIYVGSLASRDECEITISGTMSYSLRIPKQNLYMLYKKKPEDPHYEQSENFRKQVIQKLIQLKNEYEERPRTELGQVDYQGNKIKM